jgi:hypothetical protein
MVNCNQATPEMSTEAMMELIAQCPPGPWPNAWGTWDNTIEAHRRLVDQYIDNLKPSRVTYAQERGIVIAGGGLKYFPSVWVNVNLIRHFGCTLPIQLWYLGDTEMDPYMKRMLEPLGVECIDAREIEKQHPCRILCGWELKLYATLHSPFAQVLFLDADNGVVCDPTYLFECEEYQRHGAIFWPDYACWTLKPGVWKVFGMMDMAEPEVSEHERAFESGQYLIDKRRCGCPCSMPSTRTSRSSTFMVIKSASTWDGDDLGPITRCPTPDLVGMSTPSCSLTSEARSYSSIDARTNGDSEETAS